MTPVVMCFLVLLDACTMNLIIYRCKAFLNRMQNIMVAKQRRSQVQGKAVIKWVLKGALNDSAQILLIFELN